MARPFGSIFILVLLLIASRTSHASAPALVNYQGRLTTSGGTPVSDGFYTVRFRIYTDSLAGSTLWEETEPVSVSGGLFNVALGGATPMPDSVFNNPNRWLGIRVNVDPELTPRSRFTSVPYSQRSGEWTSSGTSLYRSSGFLGLGASSPLRRLHVIDSGGGPFVARFENNNPVASSIELTNSTAPATWEMGVVGSAGAFSGIVSSNSFYIAPSGSTTPTVTADVIGNVGMGLAAQATYGLYVSNLNNGIAASTANSSCAAVSAYASGQFGYAILSEAYGASGYGIHTKAPGTTYAGYFDGHVHVTGNLTKASGSFEIDHPLDPANKYLYHSFVESPDMKNIYDGVVVLDATGAAVVKLPDWFDALNRDFRYQLTAIGAPGPNLYISSEVANNQFSIAGGTSGMKVSWMVTGIRHDAWADAHRIQVEVDKPAKERGYYLHPELFNQPEERGIEWATHPEQMQKAKTDRINAQSASSQK